jgi:hypothetical protein
MPFIMDAELDQQALDPSVIDGQTLEDDINMEDLFGAEPVVAVNLPVDKRLPHRLTELNDSGCTKWAFIFLLPKPEADICL